MTASARAAQGPRLLLLPEPKLVNGRTEQRLHDGQAHILLALIVNGVLSRDDLVEILWPHPDDMPDTWYDVINTRLYRLNKALAPFGWSVYSRHGWHNGWRLCRRQESALALAA